ncbi:MAG TPA: M28 family metallopeptidase [Chloroflexota bacterium]|nr:M28 family metallopeptidase [Chloroflexota bacterium]
MQKHRPPPPHASRVAAALSILVAGIFAFTACGFAGTTNSTRTEGADLSLTGSTLPRNVEAPQAEQSATPTAVPGPRLGLPRYEALRTLTHISVLAGTIGVRVADSPGDTQAVEYIASQLQEYGYNVEIMPFTYHDDFLLLGAVRIGETAIQGLTFSGSAAGQVSAESVYVGRGDAAGFSGKSTRGKVVIAERFDEHLSGAIVNARAGGAAALLLINDGLYGGWLRPPGSLLMVEVDNAAGEGLRAAAALGARVTVETTGPVQRQSMNVIARRTPSSRCNVLVGGHHDTVPTSPGANDNASGTATVLELARAFAARADEMNGPSAAVAEKVVGTPGGSGGLDGLCFATFGAEEAWWHGSLALAARLQHEQALPRAMMNLDVTGGGNTVELIGSSNLTALAQTVAREQGIAASAPRPADAINSDHRSFAKAGVPVLFLTTGSFPTVHSAADVVAGINPASLQRVGDLAFNTITRLLEEG